MNGMCSPTVHGYMCLDQGLLTVDSDDQLYLGAKPGSIEHSDEQEYRRSDDCHYVVEFGVVSEERGV